MNFHKFVSKSIILTALLGGVTLSGIDSNINVHADDSSTKTNASQVNGTVGVQDSHKTDSSAMSKSGRPINRNGEVGANIQDGSLTLDSVPNLGFGNNNVSSQDSSLHLNSSNNSNLQVTDNRNIDRTDNDHDGKGNGQAGWNLTAQLGSFTDNGAKNSNTDSWKMTFNNLSVSNSSDTGGNSTPIVNNSNNDSNSSSALTANNNSTPTQLITAGANNSNYGYGTNIISFNNNDKLATLYIPNVQKGSYTATMNWQLNSNLNTYNTDYNTGSPSGGEQ